MRRFIKASLAVIALAVMAAPRLGAEPEHRSKRPTELTPPTRTTETDEDPNVRRALEGIERLRLQPGRDHLDPTSTARKRPPLDDAR